MSREEKFTSVTVYLAKVVDHLTGVDNEKYSLPVYQTSRSTSAYKRTPVADVATTLQSLSQNIVEIAKEIPEHQLADNKIEHITESEIAPKKENE